MSSSLCEFLCEFNRKRFDENLNTSQRAKLDDELALQSKLCLFCLPGNISEYKIIRIELLQLSTQTPLIHSSILKSQGKQEISVRDSSHST